MIAPRHVGSMVVVLAFFAPVLEGRVACADDATAQKQAAAQMLFNDGRRLTEAKNYAEACPKLAESQRLNPSIGTQFYLADCLEQEGKTASAWTNFVGAADGAKLAGQQEREAFARKRAEILEPRIPKLTITIAEATRGAAGLEVKRDGALVGAAQWGTPIPLNPGEHLVAAEAQGKLHWETKVQVKGEGVTISVVVPALVDAPVALPLTPVPGPTPLAGEEPNAGRGRGQRIIAGAVVGGLGLVGIALGTGFGVGAMGKQSDSNKHCDALNRCDPTGITLRHDGITDATVSTVGFVVGGVALAAGAVLVLTAPPPSKPHSAGKVPASMQVAVGPGTLHLSGSW